VLWRQKEQFSDGVGYNWIDSLRDYADETVSDAKFASRERRFVINPPLTKEVPHDAHHSLLALVSITVAVWC
jgi:asparagine synthase (glutamine-hydrolysing)